MSIIRYTTPKFTSWSRFDRLSSLRDLFDTAFSAAGSAPGHTEGWVPALDVFEDEETVSVQVELPGMAKEDFDISLHDDVLTITGERKAETESQSGASYRRERTSGSFSRNITLPSAVRADAVKASYQEGVLTITLPKSEAAKPRKIEVELN